MVFGAAAALTSDTCCFYKLNNPGFCSVARSAASSGNRGGRLRLGAYHFWDLQFPHLQVSSMPFSSVCAAFSSIKSHSNEKQVFYDSYGYISVGFLYGCCYSNSSAGDSVSCQLSLAPKTATLAPGSLVL